MVAKQRNSAAGGWFLTIIHSPMLGFWVLIAVLSVMTVVQLFTNWRESFKMLGSVALMATVTRAVARAKGVSPWPIYVEDDDDDDEPAAIDAIPAETSAQAQVVSRASQTSSVSPPD